MSGRGAVVDTVPHWRMDGGEGGERWRDVGQGESEEGKDEGGVNWLGEESCEVGFWRRLH